MPSLARFKLGAIKNAPNVVYEYCLHLCRRHFCKQQWNSIVWYIG